MTLRSEFRNRDESFRNTVMCFGEEEGETYALCRWLRARKFNLDDTFLLIDEAKEERKEALKHDFYPDADAALGSPVSTYIELYPQFYHGHAKNGCPLYISKPGLINYNAMECVATLEGLVKFHWNVMHHDFRKRLVEMKEKFGSKFTKFSCVCVLDLEGLSASSMNRHVMEIIKVQSRIDNLCYVETLSKMCIVNAPVFFSAIWKIIKGFLDVRTQNKIEIFSSKKKANARLLELVDAKYLPGDYGGTASQSHDILVRQNSGGSGVIEQQVKLIHLRSHETVGPVNVTAGQRLEVIVYTKSTGGADFTISETSKGKLSSLSLIHESNYNVGTDAFDAEKPSFKELTSSNSFGPGSYQIRADSKTSRLHTDYYLLTIRVLPSE